MEATTPINKKLEAEKKEKIDVAIAFVVIFLAACFIGYQVWNDSFRSEDQNISLLLNDNPTDLELVSIDDATYVPVEVDFQKKELIERPTAIHAKRVSRLESMTNPTVYPASTDDAPLKASTSSHYTMDTVTSQPTVVETVVATDSSIGEKTEIESPAPINVEPPLVDETEKGNSIAVDKSVTTIEEKSKVDKSCVIVIGAYSKGRNVKRLKERLRNDGYDIFTAPYSGLTRVGIYQECHGENITKVLETVRKKYAKAATILVRN